MGYKTLELTVISARDLKKVSLIGEMDVYAVVSLSGDPNYRYNSKQKTPVDVGGGSSPHWNHTVGFTVEESSLAGLMVVFRLRHKRAFFCDKDVGHVRVRLDDLLHKKDQRTFFSYQVRTPSGYQGQFDFSFKLSDSDWTPPPPPPPVFYALPPQQTTYGYPYGGHVYDHHHHRHHHHHGHHHHDDYDHHHHHGHHHGIFDF